MTFCNCWFWCLCLHKYLYSQYIFLVYQVELKATATCCTWQQIADGGVSCEVEVLPQVAFDQHQGDDSLQYVPSYRGQVEATYTESPHLLPLVGVH